MLRNGAGGAGSAGSLQPGDLEGRLRRLASDVRHLKDRMAELLGAGGLNQVGADHCPPHILKMSELEMVVRLVMPT
jgi:hypothetical protein